jgi:adenine-specific DNA glycosylase
VKWKMVTEDKWVLLRNVKNESTEIYLEQNQDGSWRKGLWDFPVSIEGKTLPRATLKTEFKLKYVVTDHKVNRHHRVFRVVKVQGPGHWFRLDELPGLPAPVTKAIAYLKKNELI